MQEDGAFRTSKPEGPRAILGLNLRSAVSLGLCLCAGIRYCLGNQRRKIELRTCVMVSVLSQLAVLSATGWLWSVKGIINRSHTVKYDKSHATDKLDERAQLSQCTRHASQIGAHKPGSGAGIAVGPYRCHSLSPPHTQPLATGVVLKPQPSPSFPPDLPLNHLHLLRGLSGFQQPKPPLVAT